MLLATWHPTYAFFHNPYEEGSFRVDVDRFARTIRGELRAKPEIVTSGVTVAMLRKHFAKAPFIAVDIETKPENSEEPWTGKQPTRAQLNLMGIGTTEFGLSFHWNRVSQAVRNEVKRLFRDKKVLKVFQNGQWFDMPVMKRFGIEVSHFEDTRDARRALSSTSQLSLEYMGSIYDDVHAWKKGKNFNSKRYNAMDCVVTARVWEAILAEDEWHTPRVQALYRQHVQTSRICAEMHQRGVWVRRRSRAFLAWGLRQEFEERKGQLLAAVDALQPGGAEGWQATDAWMRSLIFERHRREGFPCFGMPDPMDGSLYTNETLTTCKVDEDSLIQVLLDPECTDELRNIIDLWWRAKRVQKQRGTFVASKGVSRAIGKDGRIRAGWNSCGAETGRFSCSEPNLMNVRQYLRSMYGAPKGRRLVHADWSQLELRVMGAVSGDKMLQAALETGDVYSVSAREFFRLPADSNPKKDNPKARHAAKTIQLASNYAAGTKAVYQQSLKQDKSLRYSQVELLHRAFKTTYHGIVEYWQREHAQVLKQGYSESRIMRRRRVYPRPPSITETANYPIQSTAADIANICLIELDARLKAEVPTAFIVMQLHDAFDVECDTRDVPLVTRIMKEVMEQPRVIEGVTTCFPVEVKVSNDWSDV